MQGFRVKAAAMRDPAGLCRVASALWGHVDTVYEFRAFGLWGRFEGRD